MSDKVRPPSNIEPYLMGPYVERQYWFLMISFVFKFKGLGAVQFLYFIIIQVFQVMSVGLFNILKILRPPSFNFWAPSILAREAQKLPKNRTNLVERQ